MVGCVVEAIASTVGRELSVGDVRSRTGDVIGCVFDVVVFLTADGGPLSSFVA